MRDLLTDYRREVSEELIKLYLKGAILQEILYLFPFFRKISISDPQFHFFLTKLISKKKLKINGEEKSYLEHISPFIANEDEFHSIGKTAMTEIQSILDNSLGKGLDLFKDFPNIAFKQYECEKDNRNDYREDSDKYSDNSFFREYYIRVEDSQIFEARNQEEIEFLSRPNKFKGTIKPTIFKEWIEDTMTSMPQDRFLALVPNRYVGVRLMYNPAYKFSSAQQQKNLYESVLTSARFIYEKTNALSFRHNSNNYIYKFPLIIAKKELLLPPSVSSFEMMKNYVNSTSFYQDIFSLSNKLWEDQNFGRLFDYHIPMKIFEVLLFSNLYEKYYLMKEVIKENKVLQDLNSTIIKLLTRVKFAEDPTQI